MSEEKVKKETIIEEQPKDERGAVENIPSVSKPAVENLPMLDKTQLETKLEPPVQTAEKEEEKATNTTIKRQTIISLIQVGIREILKIKL